MQQSKIARTKEKKIKVNLRVGLRIRELLDGEAAVEDVRIGTLANKILQDELGKIFAVGADHCFVMDSRDFVSLQNDISDSRSSYYIFPAKKEIDKYISTQLDNKMYPQISFYFSSEQIEIMQSLVIKQRIPKTIRNGEVKSYRYVIAGMLLNHPLCAELGASVN